MSASTPPDATTVPIMIKKFSEGTSNDAMNELNSPLREEMKSPESSRNDTTS